MDVRTVGSVLRQLLPNVELGPCAFAVQLAWIFPAALLLCYLALMPVVILPDVSLTAYTTLYITAAGLATPAMLATIASVWVVYTYFYSVTVPVVRSMERGRSLAHLATTVVGESLLRLLKRLVRTWAHMLGALGQEPSPYLAPSPLRSLHYLGIPARLAVGWCAGTHPQVVYELDLR